MGKIQNASLQFTSILRKRLKGPLKFSHWKCICIPFPTSYSLSAHRWLSRWRGCCPGRKLTRSGRSWQSRIFPGTSLQPGRSWKFNITHRTTTDTFYSLKVSNWYSQGESLTPRKCISLVLCVHEPHYFLYCSQSQEETKNFLNLIITTNWPWWMFWNLQSSIQ